MSEVREDQLLEDKEMRQRLMSRVEVLDKVKELFLLPHMDLMTTRMVSEYFNVGYEAIASLYKRSSEELSKNGASFMKYQDFSNQFKVNGLEISPKEYGISPRGSNVFSKRAVLNVAMLLSESDVAKRVREALLDQQEIMSEKQKIIHIDYEKQLALQSVFGETEVERLEAMKNFNEFKNRHIHELNARIDEMKPKEEAFDTFISTEGYQKMNDVAKSVGYGRNKLYEFLRKQKVLMKDNQPYQSYIDREWFTVKQNTIQMGNFTKNHAQTYASPKGIDGISKMLKKHGLID